MPKKTATEIKIHYSQSAVAEVYDDRRFNGVGGKYINQAELTPILELARRTIASKRRSLLTLDVAAGRGRLSVPLLELGLDVYCLDASRAMTKFLGSYLARTHIIIQSAFDDYRIKSKFDLITSLRFFDHFEIDDHKKLLQTMQRALSKDGKIIFAALNANSLESWLSRFFPYGRYNYYYTDANYRRLFRNVGLQVESTTGSFFFPRGIFLYAQKIPMLAEFMIIVDRICQQIFPKTHALTVYLLKKK